MFLKKLEISGFKSFANKTTLDFMHGGEGGVMQGVTAIVGPNGSGKSNIADAIRWVMGEQSMKNLRGKKSEDIIFAGSGKKARLSSAQVTLFFDNTDKRIPLEFDEVSVARKIFRSGESEYIINGSRVRLQDVVDILAKAGIGKESYSIVNQGMADAILNSSPLERRLLIEDAAGVKQYQIKKERSLRKLETTKENLKRAKELAEEIKPHLKMLKRQAEKASQGEGIAVKLKEKQTKLYTYLWNTFEKEKLEMNSAKEEMGVKMMHVQRDVDRLSDELRQESQEVSVNTKLGELEKSRNEAKTKLNQLERDLIVTEGRIEIEKEKQKSMQIIEEIKIQSVPVDLGYVKKELEGLRSDQERLIERISQAEDLKELQEIKEFAQAIRQKLLNLRQDIEKGKKEEEVKTPQKSEKIADKNHDKVILDLQNKTAELRSQIKNFEEKVKKIEKDIEAEREADRDKRQKFFELERSLREKQETLNKMKDEFNESKVALARVEVREEDMRSDILKELRLNPEDLSKESEEIDKFAFESEINKLKIQLEQIGGIDPMVMEEFKETNERFEFLHSESEDLEKAIMSLKEVIKEMDQKINQAFASTFEEINKEFSKYFRIIFGGGNAHLTKVKVESRRSRAMEETEELSLEEGEERKDEKNYEIGIDIFASPPGKKISNLSMLSGGERSLTSLALLFSIISHNPPPFSVLDEVEAALDEANSRRFGRIIQELSKNTQFVTITHNRETMRQASLLYGVTMGEDGISKLLSVRLDQVGQGGKIRE